MTTEIAILNKQVAVLAADSAVSSSEKVFQSANKIFCLSKYHPVGIMIYSAADFVGIPWETIIKIYRKQLDNRTFKTLQEYANNFIEFINNSDFIINNKIDDESYIYDVAEMFAVKVAEDITNMVQNEAEEKGGISDDEIKEIVTDIVSKHKSVIEGFRVLESSKKIDFKSFKKQFKEPIKHVYNKYSSLLVSVTYDNFIEIIYSIITREIFILGFSGVVFSGFGEDEIYPTMLEYHIGGKIGDYLQCVESQRRGRISFESGGYLAGFAQQDIINMFMEGIHPDFRKFLESFYDNLIGELGEEIANTVVTEKERDEATLEISRIVNSVKEKLKMHLEDYRRDCYIEPVINVIAILPPAEVASLAEALVNITTIQRQISHDLATVGGPTDVAMITKGDGFIWVKRKHYFDAALNHQFFANYFNGGSVHGAE